MEKKRNDLAGGLILITIGALALVGQYVNLDALGLYIVAGLGVLFMLAGIFSRNSGLMVPGGILSGIGAGIILTNGPFQDISGDAEGGIFMLTFAAGWLSITVMSAIFGQRTHWWALIPAAIMALIGATVLAGGIFETTLSLLGKLWPLGLIALGLTVLFQNLRGRAERGA